MAEYRAGELIVRLREGLAPTEVQALAGRWGLALDRRVPELRVDLFRTPPDADLEALVAVLGADDRVEHVQPNYVYRASEISPHDPALSPASAQHQYGILLSKIPTLWRSTNGAPGTRVAVLDTGLDLAQAEFTGRIAAGHDFVNLDNDPTDDNGHGTRVSGVIAAGMNNGGVVGVAPLAIVLPVKVLDSAGVGNSLSIAAGLDFATNAGAKVINMSLGGPGNDALVRDAVARAYAADIVVVAASGNDGGSPPDYPANYAEVIAVGAVGATGAVAAFSQFGPNLDVVAAGVAVWTTNMGGGTVSVDGTSFASPHVAGVCALLLDRFPGMRPWEIERYLRRHAIDTDGLPQGHPANVDGFGLLCFESLRDFGNGPEAAAWSENHFFEWLGADVTGESSMNDAAAVGVDDGDDDQPDGDGRPNSSGIDGADDGLFPSSFASFPLLPPSIAPGAQSLAVAMSVGNSAGPRFAGAPSLRVQVWADWNDNGVFAATERIVNGTRSPAGWTGNTGTEVFTATPPDQHCRGNPLRIRTRMDYAPAGAAPGPAGAQLFGEVEDVKVTNFVETFDAGTPYATLEASGAFPDLGGWVLESDPPSLSSFPTHHGFGRYARADPVCQIGSMTNKLLKLPEDGAPLIDLRERTKGWLRLWAAHGVCTVACDYPPGGTDNCRLTIRRFSSQGGGFTETVLLNFPDPELADCDGPGIWSANLNFDLTPYMGYWIQVVVHHNADFVEHLVIDDVVVFAYDDRVPQVLTYTTSNLQANRIANLGWNAPDENLPSLTGNGNALIKQAEVYHSRLNVAGDGTPWRGLYRLSARDFVAHPGAPATAGAAQTAVLAAPTTFPNLAYCMRTEDENGNIAAPGCTTLSVQPAFGVLVTGPANASGSPGAEVPIDFLVLNTSTALDAFAITVTDSQNPDWAQPPLSRVLVLDGGQSAIETVRVLIPPTAVPGSSVSVLLAATSLSDPSVSSADDGVVDVVGGGVDPTTAYCFCDTGAPCGNVDASAGCASSRGAGTRLAGSGSTSVGADDLYLIASGAPNNANGIFYMGGAPSQSPFGDGKRCVASGGQGIYRYALSNSGGTGQFVLGPVVGTSHARFAPGGRIQPGQTWFFQSWYRDPMGPCASGFNLSNGVSASFGP